jgi:hypothetical protein
VGVNRTGNLGGNGGTASDGAAALYSFRKSTVTLTQVFYFGLIGIVPNNDLPNFGAVYASSELGILYGSENFSGNIYRFDISTPTAPTWEIFATGGPPTQQNDGARCINAAVAPQQTTAPAAPGYYVPKVTTTTTTTKTSSTPVPAGYVAPAAYGRV